jgi:hypothetical protein
MEILPFTSFGSLKFGDPRQVARQKLASPFSTFRKAGSQIDTDAFDDIGLHLYYDTNDCLEFVEAFDPADVDFRGIRFLGRELDAITSDMKALGFSATAADVGIDFNEAGIVVTAPSGIVEGVGAHRKGYYETPH